MRVSTWTLGLVTCWACFNGFYWALLSVLVPFAFEIRDAVSPPADEAKP